jgi:Ser/Thr protein kinase RdoA (MazF antagonist)
MVVREVLDQVLDQVLDHWALADATVQAIGSGLINRTFEVVTPTGHRAILQQVNPIFDPAIHHNIAAVTEHLAGKGLATPRLVPTRAGGLWAEHEGEIWRLQTAIAGVSVDALDDPARAEAAGRLVGRWHAALDDLEHEFVARRAGVHDTPRHLETLREALETGVGHPLYAEVEPLGSALLDAAAELEALPMQPDRVAHGDLKISNLMFDRATSTPIALVDLDTVAPMSLAHELGDAWRSWCNRATEDQPAARFDLDLFAASLRGWRAGYGQPLTHEDRRALLLGPEWISLELSARFAADAVLERYFGWSPSRFPTRGAHNLARARGQWSLHQALLATRREREALLGA